MKKKIVEIFICILLTGIILPVNGTINNFDRTVFYLTNGNILYVGGTGPNNYTKIQDAIIDANDGDTIFVFSGIYIVKEFTISKSISIIGENKYSTVIDGDGSNYVFRFGTDFINISGFTLQNVKYSGYTSLIEIGWHIRSNNNIIANNIFNDSRWYAININSADYNVIIDNYVINCGYYLGTGIYCIAVTGNIISNNTLIGSGIEIESSTKTKIVNNHVIGSQIYVHHGDNIIFEKNRIENGSNIFIEKSVDCSAKDNILIKSGSIIIRESIKSNINNNNFEDSYGVLIIGNNFDFWNTLTIENNKNDGKPIIFYKNKKYETVPKDASQVILISCNNCNIENVSIIKSCGIQLAYSSNNIICNNTISESIDSGIKLIGSTKNNISYNFINDNKNCGVESIDFSIDNNYFHNSIINNSEYGIIISEGSSNNYFYDNFIQYNHREGIVLQSNFNNVLNNLVTDNTYYGHYGIFCSGSNNNICINHIKNNYDGVYCSGSNNNISSNHIANNNDDGLKIYMGKFNLISQNNFINNDKSVSFVIDYKNETSNKWIKNYYDDIIYNVKIIWGRVQTRFGYWSLSMNDFEYYWYWFIRPGINIDYDPAKEPYDI